MQEKRIHQVFVLSVICSTVSRAKSLPRASLAASFSQSDLVSLSAMPEH